LLFVFFKKIILAFYIFSEMMGNVDALRFETDSLSWEKNKIKNKGYEYNEVNRKVSFTSILL